ncbi:hypothetical protein KAR48_01260 [bacterium]|nr:hypothetical protein [bacterium]
MIASFLINLTPALLKEIATAQNASNDTYGLNVVSAGKAFVQATAAVSSRVH